MVRDAGASTLLGDRSGKWLGTPEGWARANLLLQTLRAPPRIGSLQESVLTLLQMKLEAIDHARFRALSQIIVDKEKGVAAFEEYMKIAFPYLEASKKKERASSVEHLKQWVNSGPIHVKPLQMPNLKSRVASAKGRMAPQSPAEEKRLYRKIGRSI